MRNRFGNRETLCDGIGGIGGGNPYGDVNKLSFSTDTKITPFTGDQATEALARIKAIMNGVDKQALPSTYVCNACGGFATGNIA
jgi:hypothetical protein